MSCYGASVFCINFGKATPKRIFMFGLFKKKPEEPKRPDYDPTNIKITDLRKGFILEYDLKTWEVNGEFEYDWGGEFFTYEYQLVSADDSIFLSVEDDDEVTCIVCRKINFGRLPDEVEDNLLKHNKPPKRIEYDGRTYFRESERPGYFSNVHDEAESSEFISWEYYDETEKYLLAVEQWGEAEFEAAVGEVVPADRFSNILPGVH